jgi:hypothetical protein
MFKYLSILFYFLQEPQTRAIATLDETRCTLEGFADADSSMAKDWCTISGYTFLINGGAISWLFK